jgi:hypothetical protein
MATKDAEIVVGHFSSRIAKIGVIAATIITAIWKP